ncbi:MAG: hypothetical protein LBP59_09555 [Planctomycetaceae bacterium]|nr:hypothetical protein [Planctomycetaceae bacterium]
MSEILISSAFLFALRQSAGQPPAIRRSRLLFKIAGILGSQASRLLGSFRFAGGTPASQDRGRLACMRLYSTANERGFDRKRLFVCLAAKCRRDARDPAVSPAFQDRRHFRIAGVSPGLLQIRRRNACITGSRASRLHAVVLNR